MDTAKKAAKDIQHIEGVAIPHFQGLVAYTRDRERKIMEIKYKRNIFPEARKIVESYMKENTYANVAQRASSKGNNNNQADDYKYFIEKLMQLGPNNWPKFQEQPKKNVILIWNQIKRIHNKHPYHCQNFNYSKPYISPTPSILNRIKHWLRDKK